MTWWKGFTLSLRKIEITDFTAYQEGRGKKESKKSGRTLTAIYTFTNDVLPHLSVLQFQNV